MKKIFRRIRDQYYNSGMKVQVYIILLLLSFLPSLFAIFSAWRYCTNVFANSIRLSAKESFEIREESIQDYMEIYLDIADSIREDPELTEIIQHDMNPSITSYRLNNLAESYVTVPPSDLMGMYFYTAKDRGYLTNWIPEHYFISIRGESIPNYGNIQKIAAQTMKNCAIYSAMCVFRETPCIAVASCIGDADNPAGEMVMLLRSKTILEMMNPKSLEQLPWAFRLYTDHEELIVGDDYQKLMKEGEENSIEVERLDWRFAYVFNMNSVLFEAVRSYGIWFLFSIAAYLILLFLIAKVIDKQLHSLQVLRNEMLRAGESGIYRSIAEPQSRDVNELFAGYNTMVSKINSQEQELRKKNEENLESVKKQKTAELKAMELEINPHYFYNTLNTINALAIEHEDFLVSRLLKSFSNTLFYVMKQRYQSVTLREELKWLSEYLFLQRERFDGSFDYEIDIEDELEEVRIYKLLLQPFIENAILHGFDGLNRKGLLTIVIFEEDGKIAITISDNGRGMDADVLAEIQNMLDHPTDGSDVMIGITNSCLRMQGYYEDRFDIHISSERNVGTTIKIKLPFLPGDERNESGYCGG